MKYCFCTKKIFTIMIACTAIYFSFSHLLYDKYENFNNSYTCRSIMATLCFFFFFQMYKQWSSCCLNASTNEANCVDCLSKSCLDWNIFVSTIWSKSFHAIDTLKEHFNGEYPPNDYYALNCCNKIGMWWEKKTLS